MDETVERSILYVAHLYAQRDDIRLHRVEPASQLSTPIDTLLIAAQHGLHLTRRLKEEVGDAYRVIYLKPGEDPNSALDSRREILSNGTWLALPPLERAIPIPDDSGE